MQRIFLNVGYELSEKQLRAYFVQYGVLSDLYLPKHANGRNKGYGFATFAAPESLALVLQQPKHVVDGMIVQVKKAGPRPPDNTPLTKPALTDRPEHVPFGQGPRIYVGGVHECLTEARLREHFARWGSISDIYFPGARGRKRSNYCFVTFDNRHSAERACSESDRNLDGWPLESICMADERKVQRDGSSQSSHSLPHASPLSPSLSAGEFDTKYNYALWLQLQYRQQLAALQSTVTAAAAHELAQPRPDFQKGPRQDAQAFPFGAASGFGVSHGYGKSPEAGPSPPLERVTNPYSQPGFGFDPLQDSSIGLGQSPQWAPPALSSVDHDTARAVQPWCPDPASQLGSLNKADGSRGYQAALEQQAMLYAAQGSLQHHAAARLGAGAPDFGQADQFGQADVFGQRDANPRRNTSLQGMYLDPAGGLASNAGRLHNGEGTANPFAEGPYNFNNISQGFAPQDYSGQGFSPSF